MSVLRKSAPAVSISRDALTPTQFKYLINARHGKLKAGNKAQARTQRTLEAAGLITMDHYGCPVPTEAGSRLLGGNY